MNNEEHSVIYELTMKVSLIQIIKSRFGVIQYTEDEMMNMDINKLAQLATIDDYEAKEDLS